MWYSWLLLTDNVPGLCFGNVWVWDVINFHQELWRCECDQTDCLTVYHDWDVTDLSIMSHHRAPPTSNISHLSSSQTTARDSGQRSLLASDGSFFTFNAGISTLRRNFKPKSLIDGDEVYICTYNYLLPEFIKVGNMCTLVVWSIYCALHPQWFDYYKVILIYRLWQTCC